MNLFLKNFERKFVEIHNRSNEFIQTVPEEKLFYKPIKTYSIFSCGEFVLRSAGRVEQTFGGITTRLWDDPFEWTLPEELATHQKIREYLEEVAQTRRKAFDFFKTDDDLAKEIPTPDGMKNLFSILLETIADAENMLGRAASIQKIING